MTTEKLDVTQPYGTVVGHDLARYEQNGLLYSATMELLGTPPTVEAKVKDSRIIMTDAVASGKAFLMTVLKGNALRKAAVFKEAEANNQPWDAVKDAAIEMGIVKFKYQGQETWKLPEEQE